MVKRASLAFLSFYMYFLMNATSLETMWRTVELKWKNLNPYLRKKAKNRLGFFWVLCLLRLTGVYSVFQNWMNNCCRVSVNDINLSFSNTNENYDNFFREEHKLKCCQMPKCLSCGTKQKPKHSGFFLFFFLLFCSPLLNMEHLYFWVSSNRLWNRHK